MAFIVMCRVSGGVTGLRESPLKDKGKVIHFRTLEEADREAKSLNQRNNNPYRTCDFKYWAEEQA